MNIAGTRETRERIVWIDRAIVMFLLVAIRSYAILTHRVIMASLHRIDRIQAEEIQQNREDEYRDDSV